MLQLINLYGLAAACFALVALRDFYILKAPGGALIMGVVIVLNTLSSAATDYVMHNHSWMCKARARKSLIAAVFFLAAGYFSPVLNHAAYVLGSLSAAYVGGQRVMAGEINFPARMYLFELIQQLILLFLLGGVFSIWQFVAMRVVYSAAIYLMFCPTSDDSRNEARVSSHGWLGQISSLCTSLSLAYTSSVFYSHAPSLLQAQMARLLAYFLAAFGISFNLIAVKIAAKNPNMNYLKYSVVLASLSVACSLALFNFSAHDLVRGVALVTVSIFGSFAVLSLRVASRVEAQKE